MIWLLIVAWYVSGAAGFIYWWTTEWDLRSTDLVTAFFVGFMGPLSWVAGYCIHGGRRSRPPVVLMKRRTR